jgi:unsaturated chondroitin disaccharide hydrolase
MLKFPSWSGQPNIWLLLPDTQSFMVKGATGMMYGEGRHMKAYSTPDGQYRCPNSQQGYTGFSTWTRGLAWAMLGFAEELEAFQLISDKETGIPGGMEAFTDMMLKAAQATCDFFIENTPVDGIPYWDTGAPNLYRLGNYLEKPADPYNAWEPVDSSAAAIAAQGLLRLGNYLSKNNREKEAEKYRQAGLTVMQSLLDYPYLSTNPAHQGLILHSIYHHPNGWDHVPARQKIACGESSMWGDYHAREAALYLKRLIQNEPYLSFMGSVSNLDGLQRK